MSSGNGGGKGFFDNLANFESGGNFFEDLANNALNYGAQVMTGGLVGFENGKISNGVSTNAAKKSGNEVVSGTKEITGAKAAEQANDMARKQFEQASADAAQARVEAQAQTAKDQLQQSRMAGAARNTTASRSANKGTPVASVSLGQDEKDFLGL